jgi:hypothetical protein
MQQRGFDAEAQVPGIRIRDVFVVRRDSHDFGKVKMKDIPYWKEIVPSSLSP